jgi:signal transduction histidine kinase
MLENFKLRIAFWYTALFTIIIAVTLFSIYKIISFQLKTDIELSLKAKTTIVKQILESERREGGEEHGKNEGEKHERGFEQKKETRFNIDLNAIRANTEKTNQNYALFIFSKNQLVYITQKYKNLSSHFNQSKFSNKEIQNVTIEGIPFSISIFKHSGNVIYLGYELSSVKNLQDRLLQVFLIVFPISLMLSIICGFIVTQSSMNIIKRIDNTAKEITSNNLSKRIEETKSGDEISKLIITLNLMINRLEESFLQAKQFSQDAAHEIRTPLTIIRGEIEEIIENEQGNPSTIKKLENVLEEVHYLSSISERLLLIHNMDTNNIKYHFERINLSTLLDNIYQDVQVLSLDKAINISLSSTKNIFVNGNKELLTRLLWNISDNAIKYNKPKGKVSISLKKNDSNIKITINDTGIGIPKSDTIKIFDRFYRVDKSRTRHLGGSGLGLSICKWIVDLHDGKIKVLSEEGVGSTFSIIIASA